MKEFDVIVIGAGPAGVSAACLLAEHGATVALVDEQSSIGGQVYRGVTRAKPQLKQILGEEYLKGEELNHQLAISDVDHIGSAVVWDAQNNGVVTYSINGIATQIKGKFLLLAMGALERSTPISGWTLPGVMSAGAAQILLKTSGLVAEQAVIAGNGPLVYLLASQMIAAGYPPKAIVETQNWRNSVAGLKHLFGAVRGRELVAKGFKMLATINKAKVPRYKSADNLKISGSTSATGISFDVNGKAFNIESDSIFLHQGVVPNTQLSRALEIDHHWDDTQRCFHPTLDQWGLSSENGIYVAGDGASILGADAARCSGRIAALDILSRLSLIKVFDRDRLCKPDFKSYRRSVAIRPFLDTLYPPASQVTNPHDDVTVCRCEGVTAGQLRQMAKTGCIGPNQTKAFARCGMGPCQGRHCGLVVTEILAAEHNKTQDEIGSYRIRSPIKPITLGELSSLVLEDEGSAKGRLDV